MRLLLRLATLLAGAILLYSVTIASAERLKVSSQNFKATWTSLQLVSASAFGNSTILCPVTIEGSFHSQTIVKTRGSLIGYVNKASVAHPCTGGTATILTATLPWHITYEGFIGTLPRITGLELLLLGTGFQIGNSLATCLVRSEINHPISGKAKLNASGAVTTLEPVATGLPSTGGGLCGGATFELQPSVSTVTNGSGASITITLI